MTNAMLLVLDHGALVTSYIEMKNACYSDDVHLFWSSYLAVHVTARGESQHTFCASNRIFFP